MTDTRAIAKWLLGKCSMGVAAELTEEEHLEYLEKELENASKGLLYYLSDATENNSPS